jgi:hypothetical protein
MTDRSNLLYSNIGRAIIQLIDCQFWANLDQSENANPGTYEEILMQLRHAINQLIAERMFHLLNTHRPYEGASQSLPYSRYPFSSHDPGVNEFVEAMVRTMLSLRGHLSRPIHAQLTSQIRPEETIN